MACLVAVLFLGILLGRLSLSDDDNSSQVYLNNAAPTSASPTPAPNTGRRLEREPLGLVARPTPGKSQLTLRPAPTPKRTKDRLANSIPGIVGPSDPSRHGGPLALDEETPVTPSARPAVEAEVVRLTNQHRRERGCRPLRIEPRLVQSARLHSAEMAAYSLFSHNSPNGATPWKRMEDAGYRNGGAENIGRGYANAREAVQGWMESASHRRNILNCRLVAIGVGIAQGSGGLWWTQDFGYS